MPTKDQNGTPLPVVRRARVRVRGYGYGYG
jgi:hypothetical protein